MGYLEGRATLLVSSPSANSFVITSPSSTRLCASEVAKWYLLLRRKTSTPLRVSCRGHLNHLVLIVCADCYLS
jgi:hypothetical protein